MPGLTVIHDVSQSACHLVSKCIAVSTPGRRTQSNRNSVLSASTFICADLVNVFEVFLPQLLLYPNPTDPLNGEAAALLMREPEAYNLKVKGELLIGCTLTLRLSTELRCCKPWDLQKPSRPAVSDADVMLAMSG